jgi:hypothetical protein
MSTKPASPRSADDAKPPRDETQEEPGSNAVEHEPDPNADPIADGEHKFVPRSPYTAGND